MFSGIVETTSPIRTIENSFANIKLTVDRPVDFNDLEIGHSISVNGVCLTVSALSESTISFVVGAETCKVTGWQDQLNIGQHINLERSLRFGDRIHGHLVTGHVDTRARLTEVRNIGESRILIVRLENPTSTLFWQKGSMTLNGVSLTINEAGSESVEFCVIPETLRRTNLSHLSVGDILTVEYDYLAKIFLKSFAKPKGGYHELNI